MIRPIKIEFAIVLLLGASVDASSPAQQSPTYRNRSAPLESRVEDLLRARFELTELNGFTNVFLEPGQTKTAEIELGPVAFSYYHPKQNAWQTDLGRFEVLIGSSSKDILLTQGFLLER